MMSAFMPGRNTPTEPDRPRARAPSRVAIRSTVVARIAVGSSRETLWSLAAVPISWNMSRLLLLAQPSVPRATVTPAACRAGTGAMPEASFMLLSGLWTAFAPARAIISMSGSSSQTQWKASRLASSRPVSRRNRTGLQPSFVVSSSRSDLVSSR